MDWDAWVAEVQLAKQEFARLINASADEIAVFSSVSEATSAVASALDFTGTRRNVVVTEAEFPTIGHVWLAQEPRGARVTWVPVRDGADRLDDYDRLVDDRTAIVSASHGYYPQRLHAGHRRARDARARSRRPALRRRAIRRSAPCRSTCRRSDVDFLAAGNLKFLMGVPGIAFLYVRRDLVERCEPTVTGWFGRANPFALRRQAARLVADSEPLRHRHAAGRSTPTSRAPGWR